MKIVGGEVYHGFAIVLPWLYQWFYHGFTAIKHSASWYFHMCLIRFLV